MYDKDSSINIRIVTCVTMHTERRASRPGHMYGAASTALRPPYAIAMPHQVPIRPRPTKIK